MFPSAAADLQSEKHILSEPSKHPTALGLCCEECIVLWGCALGSAPSCSGAVLSLC